MAIESSEFYSAFVWICAALSIFTYSVIGLAGFKLPGVEQLVELVSNAQGWQIYLAAFVSIFIEGVYLIGNFFPGSTLVVILAILSQTSIASFLLTFIFMFFGWCLSGVVNIFVAKLCRDVVMKKFYDNKLEVKDRIWMTWFPAFRANYEVTQIIEGGNAWKVFFSSVRVKLWVSGGAIFYTLIIPFIIDINEISNEEGFVTLAMVGIITLIIGLIKIKHYYKKQNLSSR